MVLLIATKQYIKPAKGFQEKFITRSQTLFGNAGSGDAELRTKAFPSGNLGTRIKDTLIFL